MPTPGFSNLGWMPSRFYEKTYPSTCFHSQRDLSMKFQQIFRLHPKRQKGACVFGSSRSRPSTPQPREQPQQVPFPREPHRASQHPAATALDRVCEHLCSGWTYLVPPLARHVLRHLLVPPLARHVLRHLLLPSAPFSLQQLCVWMMSQVHSSFWEQGACDNYGLFPTAGVSKLPLSDQSDSDQRCSRRGWMEETVQGLLHWMEGTPSNGDPQMGALFEGRLHSKK